MTTIAESTKQHLKSQALKDLVDIQTRKGIREYGQTLDENTKPASAKAVHIIQEIVDLIQYLEWYKTGPYGYSLIHNLSDVTIPLLSLLADSLINNYPNIDLTHKEGFRE